MKTLADYKKQLKTRIVITTCLAIAAGILVVLVGINGYQKSAANGGHFYASMLGVSFGLLAGMLGASIRKLQRWSKAMKDDDLLKKLYVHETDERSIFIRDKMGSLGFVLNLALLALATVISGFFNPIVFITLSVTLAVTLLVYAIVSVYCYYAF